MNSTATEGARTPLGSLRTVAWSIALCFALPRGAAAAPGGPVDTLADTSLTHFVLVTNVFTTSSGSSAYLSPLSMLDGIVHTNGELRFSGNPAFTDTVSSSSGRAWFFNAGSPVELAADHNGSTDVPSFAKGFVRSAPYVVLPTNAYAQQAAALGISGWSGPLTSSQIDALLSIGGNAPPPNGIYFPNYNGALTGGFYVQGDLSQCRAWCDTIGGAQWIRMVQGSTTKTVLVDWANDRTKVWNGTSTSGTPNLTFYGTPPMFVIYVSGSVLDVSGPARLSGVAPPAISRGTQLHVVALGDIVVQGDLTCESFGTSSNVLGIFTPGGAVRIGTAAPADLRLDAFVLATSPVYGEFTVDSWDSGAPRGTLHLRGGVAEYFYGPFCTFDGYGMLQSGYARELRHDGRGVVPPYYPFVARAVADVAPAPQPPPSLRLATPFPSPSSGSVRVRYVLPRDEAVRLQVIDLSGRRIATLVDGRQSAGDHEAVWGGSGVRRARPGLYLLRIDAGGEHAVRRVVLAR